MAHGNNTNPIPGELRSVATDGVVASADAIKDYKKGKFQEKVNEEVDTEIANIKGGSTDSIASLKTAINNEKSRAEVAESDLQNAVNTEKSRAENAESTLQSNINAEKTRAEGVENTKANASDVYTRVQGAALENSVSQSISQQNGNINQKFTEQNAVLADQDDKLDNIQATVNAKQLEIGAVETDLEPTEHSPNLLTSGTLYDVYGHHEDNPEYLSVELDAEGKVLGARGIDGVKIEKVAVRTPELEINGSSSLISIEDKEERFQMVMDSDDKVVSFRDKTGALHENAGIVADSLSLSQEGLEKLAEDLSLEQGGDILQLHPKEVIVPILKTFKCRSSWLTPYDENYRYVNFNLLWFSDLHSVARRLGRISKFYNAYKDYIDDVVSCGDANHTYSTDFSFWHDNGADSFLNVMGNHECFGGQRTDGDKTIPGWIVPGFSQKECYDRFLEPYVGYTNIVIEENKTYFYKDYDAFKIRIIGIDQYHWKESIYYTDGTQIVTYPDGTSIDRGEQQTWLQNILEDARTKEYSVICMAHGPVSNDNFNPEDTPFQTISAYSFLIDPIKDEIVEEIQNFIDNGGKFITWLTGHTHEDRFGTIKSHPDQLVLNIGTAGNLIQGEGSTWEFPALYDRTENTMNDDLFDIVSINTTYGLISLYRVGCNYDKTGRHIDSICYDYINKRIL